MSNRRGFLRLIGTAFLGGVCSSRSATTDAQSELGLSEACAKTDGQSQQAYCARLKSLRNHMLRRTRRQLPNGDENAHPSFIACYSKGLPHRYSGEVDPEVYARFLDALSEGDYIALENVRLASRAKLVNPLGSMISQSESADPRDFFLAPPPAFASHEQVGEIVELYWAALCRDVPFSQYSSDPLCAQAALDLSQYRGFEHTTAGALFRGGVPGNLTGPYISQLLLKEVPYGSSVIMQRYPLPSPGNDHLTGYNNWLAAQNGKPSSSRLRYVEGPRFLCNARGLGEFVRSDFSYQAFLNAALILLSLGPNALHPNNPYRRSQRQQGFVTFGGPDVLCALAKAATYGLNAAWYQKWLVHRRLRPEEYSGRVHNQMSHTLGYPIPQELFASQALGLVNERYGSYLLPQAYPEGCPLHPAYPGGHAVVAGACVTVLKAFFDESFAIPEPKVASDDGTSLLDYHGELTLGAELNKLASNISVGRNLAGIHWRSDGENGLLLGEEVAIRLLSEGRYNYRERFLGLSFTRFNGDSISI